jgi:hypothetical protein
VISAAELTRWCVDTARSFHEIGADPGADLPAMDLDLSTALVAHTIRRLYDHRVPGSADVVELIDRHAAAEVRR